MKANSTHFILAILLCGLIVLFGVGCPGRSRKSPKPDKENQSTPAQPTLSTDDAGRGTFKNYSLVVPAEGPRVWSAEVKSGHADSKTGMLILTGVRCTMYTQGKETVHVSADTAKASVKGDVVRATMSGHVEAVSISKQQRVTASTLRWASTEKKIYAEKVNWTDVTHKMTARADHGVFSSDLTEADFNGHLRIETTGGLFAGKEQ